MPSRAEDPHDLQRFVAAQESIYPRVLRELAAGRKTSHWMWFIFPQLEGLGRSDMAQRYAIRGLAEARAYLAHPVLGPRLEECSRLVAGVRDRTISQIFGSPDDLKFRSSITLFARANGGGGDSIFERLLAQYFAGAPDPLTLGLLRSVE